MPKLAKVALILLMLSGAAEAAVTGYVASYGNDATSCTLNAPCRTLQHGVNDTPNGGELIVLDSGHYGDSLSIERSITISADGVTATLGSPGGVTINSATAVVVLRGLHLKGAGEAEVSGILVQNAAAVHIERCTVESFAARGISFSADDGQLFITDSTVRNNASHGLRASASNARITIDNSRFENNGVHGVSISSGTPPDHQSTISHSISSGNDGSGIVNFTGRMNVTWTTASNNGAHGYDTDGGGETTLESSVARGNDIGLRVDLGSTARVSRSVFTDNDTGIRNNASGTVQTFQNNILLGKRHEPVELRHRHDTGAVLNGSRMDNLLSLPTGGCHRTHQRGAVFSKVAVLAGSTAAASTAPTGATSR
jgi:hypothetical protein